MLGFVRVRSPTCGQVESFLKNCICQEICTSRTLRVRLTWREFKVKFSSFTIVNNYGCAGFPPTCGQAEFFLKMYLPRNLYIADTSCKVNMES